MLKQLTHSLSTRLLAIFVLCAALYAYGTILSLQWVFRADDLRELISGHLSLHVDYVRRDIGNPPDIRRATAITESVPVDIRISGPSVDWASDPAFPRMEELDFGASRFFSGDPDSWLNELDDVEFAVLGERRFMRLLQGPYSIIVSTKKIADTRASPPLVPIILFMGLLLVLLTYLAVRWLFRPIAGIREGAARIGRGNFEHRIEGNRRDEFGDLARDVNKLAADVQSMLDAKRQLLLGISHELRTPLSRLKLALEFLKEDRERDSLRLEIDEMEGIIGTLLEAERLNDRHARLYKQPTDPVELARGLVGEFFARDAGRIQIVAPDDFGEVDIDQPRIKLMLKNLLSNAVRHSPVDGTMQLSVERDGDTLVFAVSDRGPGFSATQADHIGEPFWRGDASRTRDTGGTGLGLYLARMVAEAHGGTLSLDREYTDGARLVVRLPM